MDFSARPVRSGHSQPLFAGVDVGGTNIKIGIVDDQGHSVASMSMPTESHRGLPDAIERMASALEDLQQRQGDSSDELLAIGLATPGTMDLQAGMILEPPNLPEWRHFPIREKLQQACGRPVTYVNDATAAAFGEFWTGQAADYSSMVLLTLGTGVGAGIILDGRTIDGAHHHGSEVGHVPIETGSHARRCGCGQVGHLEAYCSATAIVKRTHQRLAEPQGSTLIGRLAEGRRLTTKLLYEEAEAGDEFALEIILEAADYLAVGIVSVAHTIDPEIVVLGGAVDFGGPQARTGLAFLSRVREEFRRQTFPVLAERTLIEFAQLGGDAGFIGAAGLARESHYGRTTRLA